VIDRVGDPIIIVSIVGAPSEDKIERSADLLPESKCLNNSGPPYCSHPVRTLGRQS
jgi:hypothetical protein